MAAAILGALIPVNASWKEPDEGITIYLADNGIHADLILPMRAEGLDWERMFPAHDFQEKPSDPQWIAIGAGERRVYLETPAWTDITPGTIWAATTGGDRVMHVEWISAPDYAVRQIRLTPEQYRRLWVAVRASFVLDADGRPVHIDHPGYWKRDAFYDGVGKTSAIQTCNQWVASRIRLAGVKAPLWAPFTPGITWRYRGAP
nr:TIGR02117 family protein [uncultured Sphingomonas sp.]